MAFEAVVMLLCEDITFPAFFCDKELRERASLGGEFM